jgi:hypothetical protein
VIGRGIVRDVRLLGPVDYTIQVVYIAAYYLRCVRVLLWIHDRIRGGVHPEAPFYDA